MQIKVAGHIGSASPSREPPAFSALFEADEKSSGLVIENIKVLNPVAWVFSIGGSNIEMFNTLIDARSTDGFPFNTGTP